MDRGRKHLAIGVLCLMAFIVFCWFLNTCIREKRTCMVECLQIPHRSVPDCQKACELE